MYTCPYCNTSKTKKGKQFSSWRAVASHSTTCPKNNNSIIINRVYGPQVTKTPKHWDKNSIITAIINFYTEYNRIPTKKDFVGSKYPSHETVRRYFGSWNNGIVASQLPTNNWDKQAIISAIQLFVYHYGRIPLARDFCGENYPSDSTVARYFSSWNTAIEAAGFNTTIPSSFGIATQGLDGHWYRSKAEAYFADNYLFNKYTYIIEPRYPKPHSRVYDWYISELDLYIELTGGLKPEIITEKIQINKELSRKLLIINIKQMYRNDFILQIDL